MGPVCSSTARFDLVCADVAIQLLDQLIVVCPCNHRLACLLDSGFFVIWFVVIDDSLPVSRGALGCFGAMGSVCDCGFLDVGFARAQGRRGVCRLNCVVVIDVHGNGGNAWVGALDCKGIGFVVHTV